MSTEQTEADDGDAQMFEVSIERTSREQFKVRAESREDAIEAFDRIGRDVRRTLDERRFGGATYELEDVRHAPELEDYDTDFDLVD